jgi:cytochrome c553
MEIEAIRYGRAWLIAQVVLALLIGVAGGAVADEFRDALARVDRALRENPNHVPPHALMSCQHRRDRASRLAAQGQPARAERSLKHCFNLLGIPETGPIAKELTPEQRKAEAAAAAKEAQAFAAREFEKALSLEPDLERGLEIYRGCAACHTPEGWGLASGVVPQLAGQHRQVVIKQLADIRAGNRENRVMVPYASVETIGGAQAVADVAGYIDTLEISVENGKGKGDDLELGARLYAENCVSCHGAQGEGDNESHVPRIQAQHYDYLVTQFELIRDGKRRNANPEMVTQIAGFEEREVHAVLDYVSRLEPPEELQAPPGWRNPDFAEPLAGR